MGKDIFLQNPYTWKWSAVFIKTNTYQKYMNLLSDIFLNSFSEGILHIMRGHILSFEKELKILNNF